MNVRCVEEVKIGSSIPRTLVLPPNAAVKRCPQRNRTRVAGSAVPYANHYTTLPYVVPCCKVTLFSHFIVLRYSWVISLKSLF